MSTAKKIMKKHFNKNVIMNEEEHLFQQTAVGFVKNLLIMTSLSHNSKI